MDKEADADGVAEAEAEGEAEVGDDVGEDEDGGGEVGGAEVGVGDDDADEDGAAEVGADEDGRTVGVGEAGMELPIVVGAVDMGVVGVMLAGDDALAEADVRWLAAGEVGPAVAGSAVGAAAETWAAGLDPAGVGVCPAAAVKANVAAETATRPPMPNASTSGHHRRLRVRLPPPSRGGPAAPGGD